MSNKHYIILGIVLLFCSCIIITIISKNSFAYEYESINNNLFYNNDMDKLKKNINIYLNNIDDILMISSSYDNSDIIVNNYDFFLYFSLEYILYNYEQYSNEIVSLDKFNYINDSGILKSTLEYINISSLYDITNKFFGISYFVINNNNVNIIDNYISIINYTDDTFDLKIKDINITVDNDYIICDTMYEYDNEYKYIFLNKNDKLYLYNVEVVL